MLCLVIQSCPTLCDSMDCSPPGSSVLGDSAGKNTAVGSHALLQGIFPTCGSNPGLLHCRWILYHLSHQGSPRILEWVASSFSRGSSQPRIEPGSPALQADSLPAELPGKSEVPITCHLILCTPTTLPISAQRKYTCTTIYVPRPSFSLAFSTSFHYMQRSHSYEIVPLQLHI